MAAKLHLEIRIEENKIDKTPQLMHASRKTYQGSDMLERDYLIFPNSSILYMVSEDNVTAFEFD